MRHLPFLFLIAIIAGCASTTAPVVIRKVVPPEIDTQNIEKIALIFVPPGEGNDDLAGILRDEITKVIKETGRYTIGDVPPGLKAESTDEIVAAAKAAEADILVGTSVASSSSTRDGSELEVEYTLYSGQSGEKLLSKKARASGAEDRDAARGIAEGIARSLVPHGVQETLLLEYSQSRLNTVGVELARKGIWREAEKKWWYAVRTYSSESAAYHNLGVAFERRGLFQRAKTAYENAFVRNPQSPLYQEDIDRIQKILGPEG